MTQQPPSSDPNNDEQTQPPARRAVLGWLLAFSIVAIVFSIANQPSGGVEIKSWETFLAYVEGNNQQVTVPSSDTEGAFVTSNGQVAYRDEDGWLRDKENAILGRNGQPLEGKPTEMTPVLATKSVKVDELGQLLDDGGKCNEILWAKPHSHLFGHRPHPIGRPRRPDFGGKQPAGGQHSLGNRRTGRNPKRTAHRIFFEINPAFMSSN